MTQAKPSQHRQPFDYQTEHPCIEELQNGILTRRYLHNDGHVFLIEKCDEASGITRVQFETCTEGNPAGRYRSWYENGAPHIDGKRQRYGGFTGPYRDYYASGALKLDAHYAPDGKKFIGDFRHNRLDGTLLVKGRYNAGEQFVGLVQRGDGKGGVKLSIADGKGNEEALNFITRTVCSCRVNGAPPHILGTKTGIPPVLQL